MDGARRHSGNARSESVRALVGVESEDGECRVDAPVEAAQAWLSSVSSGDQSPQTLRKAWNAMRRTYGDRVVSVPLPQPDVAMIYRDMCERYSISTANLRMSALSSYWDWLIKHGPARINPWSTTSVKRQRPDDHLQERILDPDEVRLLVDSGRTEQDRLMMRFLFLTWLRLDAAANAQWSRLVTRRGLHMLSVRTKRGKTVTVPIPDSLYRDLLRWMSPPKDEGPEALILRQRNGKPYTARQIERKVEQAAKLAGDPFYVRGRWMRKPSPHWFRHAGATAALERGVPVNVVQAKLAHESLATTSRYVQASARSLEAAQDPDPWAEEK